VAEWHAKKDNVGLLFRRPDGFKLPTNGSQPLRDVAVREMDCDVGVLSGSFRSIEAE